MDDLISQQEVSLGVVKLLIEQGKDLLGLDSWGFTPLLEAANGSYHADLPNLKVLDFLLEREEYSRAEKIEAMELAGAVILKNSRNVLQFPKAFDFWRKALHLRQMEVDESGLIEKPRLNLKKTQITEWVTSEELEDIIQHPDKFVIQSFLVRLRIFSSKKWGAINYLISSDLLDDCFGKLQHQLKFVEIFYIIWAMLETLLNHRSDLRENKDAQWKIGTVVKRLIELLTFLDSYSPDLWSEEIIKTSLDFIASATQLICPILCHLIPFIRIVSRLPQMLLKKYAMEKLSLVRDHRGRSLLHIVIVFETTIDNLYATVRFLLYAGCDPNAVDIDGNSPLHYLAKINDQYEFCDRLNTVAVLLLDFGARLSRKNAVEETAIELFIRRNYERSRNNYAHLGIIGWKLPDWCTETIKLTCLSARVIRRNRISHLELPATLIPMIEKHNITQ